MATTPVETAQQSTFTNQILHGDCIDVMRQIPTNTVEFHPYGSAISRELSRPQWTHDSE